MKTVIEVAREAGYPLVEYEGTPYIPPMLEVLLETVRADEREACAKVCEELHLEGEDNTGLAADMIRARGNTA